jgi:hypothetical protein
VQSHPAPLEDGYEVLASSSRKLSRRVRLVLLAVVVVVGGVAGVRWLTQRNEPVRITAYGQPVANPAKVLSAAERRFRSYAAGRHGVLGPDARCWFQRPPGSADIGSTLLCGPVLFYDGDPSAPYLRFPLIVHGTSRPVRLEAEAQPSAPEPAAAPDGTTLVRPEGTARPVHSADITAPVPPPADADTLSLTDTVHPSDLAPASPSAIIGSDTITLGLRGYGPVVDFGTGSAERSAPDGRQLFAFRLAFTGGENGFALLSQLDLGVAVGTAAPRPLHLPDKGVHLSGQLFVIAAPPTVPLFLVLTEHGVTQRMSLRDGTPDRGNIAYLRTSHTVGAVPFAAMVPAVVTVAHRSSAIRLYISLNYARMQFFVPGSGAHPRASDHAYLSLDFSYRLLRIPQNHHFATTDVTLTPTGGSPVRARHVPGSAEPLFDVPADITGATITLTGSEIHPDYRLSFPRPIHFPLHLVPQHR